MSQPSHPHPEINLSLFVPKDPFQSLTVPEQHQNMRLQLGTGSHGQVQRQQNLLQIPTKRSDDHEFVDWQIATIRSGKFIFQELQKPGKDEQKRTDLEQKTKMVENSSQVQRQNSLTKVIRYESIGKPEKYKETEPKSPEKMKEKVVETLDNHKLLKLIFVHFCKENYISSIKSTLFEDKQKSMEEMSMNKWMVFCKQFDVFSKLCSLKIQRKKKNGNEGETLKLQNSQVKEQTKVKQIKQVQKCLSNVFKKASENHIKMTLGQFTQAIKLVWQQFKAESEQLSHLTEMDFAKTYLYCSSEKQCQKKLSNLKFTFGIPQIDYDKSTPVPIRQTQSKSRFDKSQTKQNHQQAEAAEKPPAKKISKTMKLNPIIQEAKSTVVLVNNRSTLHINRNYISNVKLTLDESKKNYSKSKPTKNKLQELLDSSKDDILQTYFKVQKLTSLG